ncbi:MAG: serine hydrolase domain-containing protein, partial [Myxococcota bacterium]
MTEQFQAIYEHGNIHGFSVSVVDAEQVLYQNSFGYANVKEQKAYSHETKQPMASISKTLVGISLLKAQELGKLHLDDPINQHLPFPVRNPSFPNTDITIRHLAQHSSSIVDPDFYDAHSYFLNNNDHLTSTTPTKVPEYFNPPEDQITLEEFIKQMLYSEEGTCCRATFLNEKPGTVYRYSNGATTLAAVVLEAATGMSFVDFTQKYIFAPLDMSASSWNAEDTDATLYYDGDTVFA